MPVAKSAFASAAGPLGNAQAGSGADYVIYADALEGRYELGIAAVFSAEAEFDVRVGLPCAF